MMIASRKLIKKIPFSMIIRNASHRVCTGETRTFDPLSLSDATDVQGRKCLEGANRPSAEKVSLIADLILGKSKPSAIMIES